ncbi:MAG: alpha/beta hydrolase [Cyclobacteriaceae bacterium]
MTENCVVYSNNRLFYYKYGEGKKFIFLFHGFGQDHRSFEPWVERLKEEYTLISVDLFFHGLSDWIEERTLEKSDWKEILQLIFQKENIEKFDVGAFSLGGKFALATYELFPERINKMTLVAADGVKINFWYKVATYPWIVRKLFKRIVTKPDFFFGLVSFLKSFGIVDKSLLRFAQSQMDTEEKRKRVFNSWVYFRHLQFDIQKIASIFNVVSSELVVIVGKFDKVVPLKMMKPLADGVKDKQIHVLETGHNDLIIKSIQFL